MPLIFCNAKRRYVGNMSCYVYITANNKIGFQAEQLLLTLRLTLIRRLNYERADAYFTIDVEN